LFNKSDNLSSSVNTFVDKVYVLSVKTFSTRIAHIKNEMQKHNINYEFIFSYDIPEIDNLLLETAFVKSALTMAQISLVLKHIHAWRDAEAHGYKKILIFEDDVILHKEFGSYISKIASAMAELPPNYLIFLGGADSKVPDAYLLSKDVLVELPIATAEAYITDLSSIQRRLNWLSNNKVALPADHLICKVDKLLGIANFWSRKPIVEQGSVTGIFDSVLDSHRQKHSRTFNVLRYRWNKLQRHVLRSWIAHLKSPFTKLLTEKNNDRI
jgi:glycosyl transferase, family 25